MLIIKYEEEQEILFSNRSMIPILKNHEKNIDEGGYDGFLDETL